MFEFLLPVAGYLIFLSVIASASQKASRFATFSVADRKVPTAILAATVTGTYVGPGFSMGWVGKGAQFGYLFAFLGLAYVLQTVLVGLVLARQMRRPPNCHTLADYMGSVYGPRVRLLVGIVSVGVCAGFSAVMIKAGAILLGNTFNISPILGAIIIASITTIYTTAGGLRASVTTDAFQFSFFGIALSACFAFVFYRNWPQAESYAISAWQTTGKALESQGPLAITGLLLAFFLGETLIPPYATRVFAAKSDHASRRGFLFSGLYGIPWFFMMVVIGIQLGPLMPAGTPPDEILVQACHRLFPPWLGGFVFAALFAIIMSSLTSLLNSGAVSLTRDVMGRRDETQRLPVARWATVVLSIISLLAGVLVPGLVEGLILCYTVWAPAILPSVVFSLLCTQPRHTAGFVSVITGAFCAISWHYMLEKQTHIDAIIPSLALSVIAFLVCQFTVARKAPMPSRG